MRGSPQIDNNQLDLHQQFCALSNVTMTTFLSRCYHARFTHKWQQQKSLDLLMLLQQQQQKTVTAGLVVEQHLFDDSFECLLHIFPSLGGAFEERDRDIT